MQAVNTWLCTTKVDHEFLINYLKHNVDTCSKVTDGYIEGVSYDTDVDDMSS